MHLLAQTLHCAWMLCAALPVQSHSRVGITGHRRIPKDRVILQWHRDSVTAPTLPLSLPCCLCKGRGWKLWPDRPDSFPAAPIYAKIPDQHRSSLGLEGVQRSPLHTLPSAVAQHLSLDWTLFRFLCKMQMVLILVLHDNSIRRNSSHGLWCIIKCSVKSIAKVPILGGQNSLWVRPAGWPSCTFYSI